MDKVIKDKIIIFCFGVLPFVIVIGLFIGMNLLQYHQTIDALEKEIEERINVSQEYIDGWNDCVKFFKSLHATNMTVEGIFRE